MQNKKNVYQAFQSQYILTDLNTSCFHLCVCVCVCVGKVIEGGEKKNRCNEGVLPTAKLGNQPSIVEWIGHSCFYFLLFLCRALTLRFARTVPTVGRKSGECQMRRLLPCQVVVHATERQPGMGFLVLSRASIFT